MKKIVSLLTVSVFAAVLIIPLICSDFQGGSVLSGENRYAATFPKIEKENISEFTKDFDSWINDNIGGRGKAQAIVNYVNHTLANEQTGDVVEGKEQWLYLLPSYDVPEYTGADVPDDNYLEYIHNFLSVINSNLKNMGIDFVLAMYPRKYEVYPEYMPDTLKKVASETFYTTVAESLRKDSTLRFVAPYEELLAGKETRLTYSKAKDTGHWNNYGAFIGYQCLMREIKEFIPALRILDEDDFIIQEQEFETAYSNGFRTTEADLIYTLKKNNAVIDTDHLFKLGMTSNDEWKSYRYYKNQDESLPKVVIVGDSFTWMFMLENMAQSFSELAFVHYNDVSQLNLLVSKIRPDLVVGAFLGNAIVGIRSWVPELINAEENVLYAADAILPVNKKENIGYLYIDYCGSTLTNGESNIYVDPALEGAFIEGWAIDSISEVPAGRVVVQVGNKYYDADYGKERTSVGEVYGKEYIPSGFTILLDTNEVLAAGSIAVHVISQDGMYQYPPVVYTVNN